MLWTFTADKNLIIIDDFNRLKLDFFSLYVTRQLLENLTSCHFVCRNMLSSSLFCVDRFFRAVALQPATSWPGLNYIYHFQGRLGLGGQLGQVDFYPNGGSLQAGCANNLCLNKLCIGKNLLDLFKSKMYYYY